MDSNDRERVQESADELQKMVSARALGQSPGVETDLCRGVKSGNASSRAVNVCFSLWTQTQGDSHPVLNNLGQVTSRRHGFSQVFTSEPEMLVGRGDPVMERSIILRPCFSISKFCHFD